MKEEVAIIGISLKVANLESLTDLWNCIQEGHSCFNDLSPERKKDIFDRFGEFELSKGAYLDRVDLFDNEFFHLSEEEAVRMDPEQRLMLQCAVKAIYNAGYQIKELNGKRVGVFHTLRDSYYKKFFDDTTPFDQAGHNAGIVGTRIAHFMNWRGPVIGMAAACSSSLSAVYYACQSIINEECSMAMVGGASLIAPIRKMLPNPTETTKRGQFIPYNDDPGQPVYGEGVFCLLLKKADEAIKDRDPIHAIIKGGAINNSGDRLQNFVSPNPKALTEVIQLAWKNSKVSPARIRFMEGMGKGTYIGDAIEMDAIATAFRENGVLAATCSVSSGTAQTGQMGTVSGMAGLVRLILALKHKQLLPQWGFRDPNDQIREEGSPVFIQRQMEYWNSEHPRIGGISSHGLTSTNVHLVLKEFQGSVFAHDHDANSFLMRVGGRTMSLALKAKDCLQKYLQHHQDVRAADLCYTMNKLVEYDQYGVVIPFQTVAQLQQILSNDQMVFPKREQKEQQVYLVINGLMGWQHMETFLTRSTILNARYQRMLAGIETGNNASPLQKNFLLQYCAIKLLFEAGFRVDKIIGIQAGKLLSYLLTNQITLTAALNQVDLIPTESFDRLGFQRFLNGQDSKHAYFWGILGDSPEFISCFNEWINANRPENIQAGFPCAGADHCFNLVTKYYNAGNQIDLNTLFTKAVFLQDLELPVFEPKRWWPNGGRTKPAFEEYNIENHI